MKSVLRKAYIAAILFLIVGGMAWGWMAATGRNFVSRFFGSWAGVVYGLVGLSALFLLMFGRDAFLPFLGETIYPCSVMQDKVPEGADTTVSVSVRPGAKVLYWASEPSTDGLKEIKSWREAYGSLENAGIATADGNGVAILKFRKPQPYTVGMNRVLQVHVHYRQCRDGGWLEPVQTHFLEEAFQMEAPIDPPMEPVEQPVEPVEQPMQPIEQPAPIEEVPQTMTLVAESPMEGFVKEPLLASVDSIGTSLGGTSVDPRLFELKQKVQQESNELIDSNTNGFTPHVAMGGTELDEAFAPPATHPIPPAV